MNNEKHKFSEEKLEEIQRIFNEFDKNKDGTICISELGEALTLLGCRLIDSDLKEMIKEFDRDISGTLNFDEFLQVVSVKINESTSDEHLAEALKVVDMNGDGIISCNELIALLTTVGDRLSLEEVEEILKEIDPKGEGIIKYSDLLRNNSIK